MAGCHTLAVIYDSVYGEAPMYMTAYEEVIGLPGDVEFEEMMAAVVLLNEVRK